MRTHLEIYCIFRRDASLERRRAEGHVKVRHYAEDAGGKPGPERARRLFQTASVASVGRRQDFLGNCGWIRAPHTLCVRPVVLCCSTDQTFNLNM